MARPRKPVEQHDLEGTTRPDRISPTAIPAPAGPVKKPGYLTGRAAAIWKEYAPLLVEMRTLTPVDARNFARWCVLEAEFERLGALMSASLIAQQRIIGDALGMSASARAKGLGAKSDEDRPADPAEDFFAGPRLAK